MGSRVTKVLKPDLSTSDPLKQLFTRIIDNTALLKIQFQSPHHFQVKLLTISSRIGQRFGQPSLAMKDYLQNRIESISAQMNKIEATRVPLLSKLAELNAALRDLQYECNTIVNQLAPVASLPNEVLSEIFETLHALQDGSDEFIPFAECARAEAVVSHVTRHWRHVALETPRIWTRIVRRSKQKPLEKMQVYLVERSKTVPIRVAQSWRLWTLTGHIWQMRLAHKRP